MENNAKLNKNPNRKAKNGFIFLMFKFTFIFLSFCHIRAYYFSLFLRRPEDHFQFFWPYLRKNKDTGEAHDLRALRKRHMDILYRQGAERSPGIGKEMPLTGLVYKDHIDPCRNPGPHTVCRKFNSLADAVFPHKVPGAVAADHRLQTHLSAQPCQNRSLI